MTNHADPTIRSPKRGSVIKPQFDATKRRFAGTVSPQSAMTQQAIEISTPANETPSLLTAIAPDNDEMTTRQFETMRAQVGMVPLMCATAWQNSVIGPRRRFPAGSGAPTDSSWPDVQQRPIVSTPVKTVQPKRSPEAPLGRIAGQRS